MKNKKILQIKEVIEVVEQFSIKKSNVRHVLFFLSLLEEYGVEVDDIMIEAVLRFVEEDISTLYISQEGKKINFSRRTESITRIGVIEDGKEVRENVAQGIGESRSHIVIKNYENPSYDFEITANRKIKTNYWGIAKK